MPLTCQYDSESSFIVDLKSVVTTGRKSLQKGFFEDLKIAVNLIKFFLYILGFESVSIQIITPKSIRKVSRILKIGSVEAEIANFVKN